MQKTIFFLACSVLLFCQCRSLRPNDFRTTPPMPKRLPPLRLLIHQASFGQAFDAAAINPSDPWATYAVTQGAMLDVSHFFQYELANNVMQSGGAQAGQARFKLLFYDRHNSGWGYTIPSVITFWGLNVLGLPAGTVRCDLELQLEIADTQGRPIVTYSAPAVGKAKVAMYYGYTVGDAVRKANLEALKSALKSIEAKMKEDVPTLTAQLAAPNQ